MYQDYYRQQIVLKRKRQQVSDSILDKMLDTIYEYGDRISALEARLGSVEKDTVGLQTYGPLPRPSPDVDREVVTRVLEGLGEKPVVNFPTVTFPRPAGANPVDWKHDPVAALNEIEKCLADALGGAPDDLLFTDPRQFSVTTDMRPFMRALGGEWNEVLARADEKRLAMNGRPPGAIIGDQEEGSSLPLGLTKRTQPVSDKDGHA